jgi:hypothetical protein
MATISVEHVRGATYRVTVAEGDASTVHDVTVTPETLDRYAPAGVSADRLIKASFEFLLARESKESILRQFALPIIERYFPEYRGWMKQRLGSTPDRNDAE